MSGNNKDFHEFRVSFVRIEIGVSNVSRIAFAIAKMVKIVKLVKIVKIVKIKFKLVKNCQNFKQNFLQNVKSFKY